MSLKIGKSHAPRLFAARSDVGSVREHNEDSFLVKTPLFVVADGMGGHEAGEIASKIAVDTMSEQGPKSTAPEAIAAAVIKANEAVLRGARDGTGKPGMGTTLTAAFFYDDEVTVAQVGDSRAYLLHDKRLQRITRDHSLIADLIEQGRLTETEARFHPQRSVITRALGSDPNMVPDVYQLNVEEGDKILLCSDGLSSMVSDDVIESILVSNPEPAQACDALVEEAIAAGGLDNVTVIVIDPLGKSADDEEDEIVVEQVVSDIPPDQVVKKKSKRAASTSEDAAKEKDSSSTQSSSASGASTSSKPSSHSKKKAQHSKKKKRSKLAPLIWVLAFVIILAGAAIGFFAYAQNSYYIVAEDGIVNVYRGLPGSFAGISASWLEAQAPDVDVSKLTPTTQSRLSNGISVNSLEEANNLIAEYRQTSNRG